jgi:hypothetical protein
MVAPIVLAAAAVLALAWLAALRVMRVRSGRAPHPSGWRLVALAAGLLLGPPIVLLQLAPKGSTPMSGLEAIMTYLVCFGVLFLLLRLVARVVVRSAPVELRSDLLLALVGRETVDVIPFDPPMTVAVAAQVDLVDSRNAEFPRGAAFMHQVDLPGFRSNWDALDEATSDLERSIADAGRLGSGIAERALATAADARARLEALRRDASGHNQVGAF